MTSTRQELLAVLAELSARHAQSCVSASSLRIYRHWAKGLSAEGLWDAEDEGLVAARARKQLAYSRIGANGFRYDGLGVRAGPQFCPPVR